MPSGPQFKNLHLDKNVPDPGKDQDDYYYTPKELSGILNLAPSTLSGYRRAGVGPRYIMVGYRSCRYPKKDVLQYLEERARFSTSQ